MKKVVFCAMMMLGSQTVGAQLVINELMQSNIDCVMDDLKEFPDSWVELYNPTKEGINLNDYKLGTSDDPTQAWTLPYQMVGGGQYVLVYCDKEARSLHTTFRLDSGKGCSVYLFKGSEVVDKVADLKKQPAPNIAYGRKTDGANEWGYQLTATPNEANTGGICDHDHILGEPVFSQAGFAVGSTKTFNLTLSLPEGSPAGTEIHYTTNGSEPTLYSTRYTEEIPITKSTAIRAKLFCDGWLSPRSSVQSYIFHDRKLTIPIISLVTDDKYLNDSQIGIFKNNYGHEKYQQVDWRRPLNLELFDTEGAPSQLNQLCETRITGAWSREASRKSMAIYAHKRFGKKNMEYEFFPDQCPGLTNYKSVVLRNSGNDRDYIYMRDAVCQRTMAKYTDIDWQAWRPSVVYINGNYWGILNIRERANDNNIITHYDGLEDIDLLENGILKEGTTDHYNDFIRFYSAKGHTLEEFAQYMDWEEYICITVMNMYFNNLDYPGNNNVMWRPRAEGGRWRWIAKDLDYTMGLYDGSAGASGGYDHQIIAQWYDPGNWNYHKGANFSITSQSTKFFRQLMDNEDFAREFIDRFCIYMGDFLNNTGIREVWDPMYYTLSPEWKRHRTALYGDAWWPNYDDEVRNARNWVSKRTAEMYKQLGNKYALGSPIPMTVNISGEIVGTVRTTFNGVSLSKGKFDGKFFANRTVTLEGQAPEGQILKGWKITTKSSSGSEDKEVSGERITFTMPSCSSIAINAILGSADGATVIESVGSQLWTWHKDGQRLVVSGVEAGTRVELFDLRGMMLHTTISDGSDIVLTLPQGQLCVLKVGGKAIKVR